MVHYARRALIPALCLGWLLVAGAGLTQAQTREIRDDAGMFTPKAEKQANADIAQVKSRFKKDLIIETLPGLPEGVSREEFPKWARTNAKRHLGVEGIYVVIVRKPGHVEVVTGEETRKRMFTTENEKELAKLMKAKFEAGDRDGALTTATSYVLQKLENNRQAATSRTDSKREAPAATANSDREGVPWLRYILIGLAILVVVWIVIALIRAVSGAAGGGGYAGGPGYAGGGGGGGGFFSSFLAGLFGAAAGMWLYNNFFGHSTPTAGAGQDLGGGAGATGPSDAGGEYSSSGADFTEPGGDEGGGDAGGGDAGGGDADWGGDAGGGGDWGGGGGDWGGGGGDFGGGGGDW